MRRWKLLVVLAGLTLAGILAPWYWFTRFLSGIPGPDQVVTMQATPYGSSDQSPEVRLFNVPLEHFAPILATLQPYTADPHPSKWQVLGGFT
jgi:hypothetical protein